MRSKLDYIESLEFSATINVCSGFSCVKNALVLDSNLEELSWELDEWQNQLGIYERICALISVSSEENYEHQYDVAFTAYLYILSKCNMPLAVICSNLVLTAPRCFWSHKMAAELKNGCR